MPDLNVAPFFGIFYERIAGVDESPHGRLMRMQYRLFDMNNLPKYHALIQFGAGIPPDAQGKAMLAFEKHLRELTGSWVEVFKETKADDSKLRRSMTAEERARL